MKQIKSKKIGIYGGTFDPLHFGHLSLAIDIYEIQKLDEIWFCPARLNPHKQSRHPDADIHHRIEMLKLAFENLPHFKVIDLESKRAGPSYTIDTLKELMALEKESQERREFCLIIGDDAVESFCQWNQPEEIVRLVSVFVGKRSLLKTPVPVGSPAICEALEKGRTDTHHIEISSTEIRERLKKGMYCGHLVPSKVLDYICQNQLYSI